MALTQKTLVSGEYMIAQTNIYIFALMPYVGDLHTQACIHSHIHRTDIRMYNVWLIISNNFLYFD